MNRVHYTACPVCSSKKINPLLTVPDHSVSKEEFVIWQCEHCTLRFTQDVPDEESIGAYYKSDNYISHTDTNKGLINKLYKKARTVTLLQKQKLITQMTGLKKGKLLDMGAGTGAFLKTMQQAGWEIEGIEPDEEARVIAKKTNAIDLMDNSFLNQLKPASFDAITLWHVLEHVHTLHIYIEKLKSLLTPNAKLFIAVPNYKALDANLYNLYWAAYDVPRHLYHFTPQSINVLMELHGLKVAAKKPMWLDSFYISLMSSKYQKGKSNWLAAGMASLRSNVNALFNTDKCSSVIYIIQKA
jgi:2-polyprenyl-3-methyl-5-hydroxy-6-metoxy-1,4-benzoquinol methylase